MEKRNDFMSANFIIGILAMEKRNYSCLQLLYWVFWQWKTNDFSVCISFYLWGDFSLDED
jgi:hypothetical protein